MDDTTSPLRSAPSSIRWDEVSLDFENAPVEDLAEDADRQQNCFHHFINFGVDHPGRTAELMAQGATNSVTSTAGFFVDAASFLNPLNLARMGGNLLSHGLTLVTPKAWEDGIRGALYNKSDRELFATTTWLTEKTQFAPVEPMINDPETGILQVNENAGIERVYLYGTQAAGEIATFFFGGAFAGGAINATRALSPTALKTGKMSLQSLHTARRVDMVADAVEATGRATRAAGKAAKAAQKAGTSTDDAARLASHDAAKHTRNAQKHAQRADELAAGRRGRTLTNDFTDGMRARRTGQSVEQVRGGALTQDDLTEYVATKFIDTKYGLRGVFSRAGLQSPAQKLKALRAQLDDGTNLGREAITALKEQEDLLVKKVARKLEDVNTLATQRGLKPIGVDEAMRLSRTTEEFGRPGALSRLFKGGARGTGRFLDPLDGRIGMTAEGLGATASFGFGYWANEKVGENRIAQFEAAAQHLGGGDLIQNLEALGDKFMDESFDAKAAYEQMIREQEAEQRLQGTGSAGLRLGTQPPVAQPPQAPEGSVAAPPPVPPSP
ncbi:MAG: hypothetical protein ACLFP8_07025 [Alphaproteobacteria bacterium]